MLKVVSAPTPDKSKAANAVSSPLISGRGLVLDKRGKRLIHGIDVNIAMARRTVIMGANGAGKSLLLRLLHGMVVPTQGRILWKGQPLTRATRASQAMVFQNPVMLRRSVRANLRFALGVRGLRGAERRECEEQALQRAGLSHLANRPAKVLSGGEQQRLAVARALACMPEILFLDEPTSSLDPASTLMVEDLITQAYASGVTAVMVTHDLGQARRMGDDVIFMHAGRIAESGSADQVLKTPRSAAARAWLDGRLYIENEKPNLV